MKSKILLSIICPAYNAEETIGKLIESIVVQKYKNYEIIVLNDGSKDDTWKIIDKYSKKYDNVIGINKKNTGVGDTRNEGLKIARGKYITFADADDSYSPDFFSKIIPEIEKEDFELLVFNANVMNYDEYMHDLIPNKYKEGNFTEKDGVQKYLHGEFCHRIGNVPWNKIFINKIIKENKLEYEPNKKRGQDLLFNILYVSKINKYKYVDEKLYNYALNMNTSTTRDYRKIEIEENIKFYEPIKKICIDNCINDCEQYIGLFFLRRFPGVVLNETNNESYEIGKENIRKYVNSDELEKVLDKTKMRYLDSKLLIAYIFYKLKLYNIVFYILWHSRNKRRSKK